MQNVKFKGQSSTTWYTKKMFSSSVNPVTGKQEWIILDSGVSSEDADISKELARSQYGDMLHDKERVIIIMTLYGNPPML